MGEQDIQKYEQMLAQDPNSRAFAPLAEAHRKAGNLDQAVRIAEAGLKIHPEYSGGMVVLGRALYEKKELEKASEVLKKAVLENPESYLGQKFLGEALLDKGDVQGALQALEAAHFLSPDDGEVERLLESVRLKAISSAPVEFSAGARAEGEIGEILTPEIKSKEAEGEALIPPPVPEKGGEDDVDSLSEASSGPAIPEPSMDRKAPDLEEDADISPVPEESGEKVLTGEEDYIEELGFEAVAFLEDAEDAQDDMEIVAEEEELPLTVEAVFPAISGETGKKPVDGDRSREEETRRPAGWRDSVDPFAVLNGRRRPIVVTPPSFTSTELAGPGPKAADPLDQEREEKPPVTSSQKNAIHPEDSRATNDVPSGFWEGIPHYEKPHAPAPGPVESPADGSEEKFSTETLADLYARQGLREKAADIYRKILVQRPGDNGILVKLRALEGQGAGMDTPRQDGENPETGKAKEASANDRDPLAILERWLENAERMKKQ